MRAATVQQFLERYEVGQTIGVGGKCMFWRCSVSAQSAVICCSIDSVAELAGFSVVKAGTDKKTGVCVAIKVSRARILLM